MFVNVSELWFFLRTKDVLNAVCGGSPSSCKDYKKFYEAFEVKPFDVDSTQAFTGLLLYKKNDSIALVYKASQEENNAVVHEYEIMRQLDVVARKCPNFVRVYGLATYLSKIVIAPFKALATKGDVERRMLLMEYVHHLCDFEEFVSRPETTLRELVAMLAQVLVAIRAMRALEITHNDLHAQNILVRHCDRKATLKYIFAKQEFIIPSLGHVAVIIDFGLGRCRAEANQPLLGTFQFTHYGYYMDRFSPAVDYVHFIASLRSVCKTAFPAVSRWCTSVLKPLKGIDQKNGWDDFCSVSAADAFSARIRKLHKVLLIDDIEWVDNLQLLINRPVEALPDSDITVFADFFNNWRAFEERINSHDELNYLFASFVRAVKMWRADYLNKEPTAVERIKRHFLQDYEKVIQFHCPAVDYDAMVCSLILGAAYLEGFYHRNLEALKAKRPRRGGPLSRPNCDDELWGTFMETFGAHLEAPVDAKVIKCHLETIN